MRKVEEKVMAKYVVNCLTVLAVEADTQEDAIRKFIAQLTRGGFSYRVRSADEVRSDELVMARLVPDRWPEGFAEIAESNWPPISSLSPTGDAA